MGEHEHQYMVRIRRYVEDRVEMSDSVESCMVCKKTRREIETPAMSDRPAVERWLAS